MKSQRAWILVACLVAMAAAPGAKTPSARGQEAATPSTGEPQFTVYQLRHADSISAAEQLGRFFASDAEHSVKIVPDLRVNSLLVQAAGRQQEMIAKILKRIDVEAPQSLSQETKVFSLKHARASDLSEVLPAIADRHNLRIAIDQRTNSIVAHGWPMELTSLSGVLESLDASPPDAVRPDNPMRADRLADRRPRSGKNPGAVLQLARSGR